VKVLHEGRGVRGWVTAQRYDRDGWRPCVRYVVAVGCQHYLWKHGRSCGGVRTASRADVPGGVYRSVELCAPTVDSPPLAVLYATQS